MAVAKGVVLLMAAGAGVLAMRKTSAAARQVVWLGALVALLALPLVSAALPSWQVLPVWARVEVPPKPAAPDLADWAGWTVIAKGKFAGQLTLDTGGWPITRQVL